MYLLLRNEPVVILRSHMHGELLAPLRVLHIPGDAVDDLDWNVALGGRAADIIELLIRNT